MECTKLLQRGKHEKAKNKIIKNNLDIFGKSEIGWKGNQEISSEHFQFYYSGMETSGKHEVESYW